MVTRTIAVRLCRTILDIQETRGDFWTFFQQHWGPLVASKQTRIGLFNSQSYI